MTRPPIQTLALGAGVWFSALAMWPTPAAGQEAAGPGTAEAPEAARDAHGAATVEGEDEHRFHLGVALGTIVDYRREEVALAAGPVILLEWRLLPLFSLELTAGVAFGPPDPVFVIELAPEIMFDVHGVVEPFVIVGPTLTFEVEGSTSVAVGGFLGGGVNIWPSERGVGGFYVKAVYRVLGGPELIQQGGFQLGGLVRL